MKKKMTLQIKRRLILEPGTRVCNFPDCDCNVGGFCSDPFAHVIAGTCMSYNPVDKGGDDD